MTKQEIITETKDFYAADPIGRRSIKGYSCAYIGENNTHCGIARVMIDPLMARENWDVDNLLKKLKRLDGIMPKPGFFKPQYDGHEVAFWQDIQMFHDISENWSTTGLSERGQTMYDRLMEGWKE